MKFPAIFNNRTLIKATRRLIFSLLSIWMHFAALFYVTMILFARGENGPNQAPESLRHEEKKIMVAFKPQATTTSVPAPNTDQHVEETREKERPPPKEPEPQAASTKPAQPTNSEGVLNCDALTKKPQLVASGESFMQIKNIDSTAGSATLREKINREGIVIEVEVESSTMSKKLEEQVVASAYHSVFSPGEMSNVPVDCSIRFKVSSEDVPNP